MAETPDATPVQLQLVPVADAPQPPPTYSNFLQASFTPEDFTLRFGWYTTPAFSPESPPPSEGVIAVPVEPVARITVPLNLMRNVVALLNRQIEAYETSFGPLPKHPGSGVEEGVQSAGD